MAKVRFPTGQHILDRFTIQESDGEATFTGSLEVTGDLEVCGTVTPTGGALKQVEATTAETEIER